MKGPLIYWAPLAAYLGLVFAASLAPMPDKLPNYWQMDKLYHFGAYLVMGLLWARAFNNGRAGRPGARVFFAAAAVTFLFGAFVEACQVFFPYRSADALDALINGTGGTIGAALWGRVKALV